MKSELFIYAVEFRKQAENVWSEETAYPGQFDSQNRARGQCGISSFGLGLWLVQKKAWSMQELKYARGALRGSDGRLIGPNHSWLEVVHEDIHWQVDVTPDQYSDVDDIVIMQDRDWLGDATVQHVTEKITPFDEYDVSKFSGRLAIFAQGLDITV